MNKSTLDARNWLRALGDWFAHGNPVSKPQLTDKDVMAAYQQNPSITDKLPWIDLVGKDGNAVLLEDAHSVGAVFDIRQLAVEGRSEDYLVTIRNTLMQFVTESADKLAKARNPWVFSIYAKRETVTFRRVPEAVRQYAYSAQNGNPHPFTDHYIDHIFTPHYEDLAREQGLFKDELTHHPWGGCLREIRLVVYRRVGRTEKNRLSPEQALESVCRKVTQNLQAAEVDCRRLNGQEIRTWLVTWLNPRPKTTHGDVKAFCDQLAPIDAPEERPFDWSLADDVTSRSVRSDDQKGLWWFDDLPHRLLSVERLSSKPEIGQLTAERILGGGHAGARSRSVCLLDRLPVAATLILTWSPMADSIVNRHLDRIDKAAKSDTAEAEAAQEASAHARRQLIRGNPVFPFTLAIALRGHDEEDLNNQMLDVDSLLSTNKLQIVDPDDDAIALDLYIRNLPFAHDPRLDQVKRRNRLIFSQHLTNLLPIYGRGTGSGRPGISFFNRGGEPFTCDPLTLKDRSKNAHLFMFGPTGAGKSATLNYLIMHYAAVYRPRFIIVEAGNSFGLLVQYLQSKGFKAVDMTLKPGSGASIPVFKDALKLLDDNGKRLDYSAIQERDGEVIDRRDYLGEMMLKAKLMITGGRPREEERFARPDEAMLKQAIVDTAIRVFSEHSGKHQDVIISDVEKTLRLKARDAEGSIRDRINEMAESMSIFCTGFEGDLFNTTKSSWSNSADITRIDMATLTGPEYKDRLALAYIGLINEAMAMAEANQHDGRPTIMLTDEGHVITTNPITAAYKVLISKLSGRRMGFWLWDATQNMQDYPDEAEKMLSMFEWWICLSVGKKELEHLKRFRALSNDEESMALSARKQSGKYTEGCFLADNIVGQFRNVPPAICLALAQTEKEEKTARAKIMDERQCLEWEAAVISGEQIAAARRIWETV